jgi:AcrR family transcriptional regulator
MAGQKIEGSPRERLLAAADELFYSEGVHTVGIDRVLERAGVAKASLYSTFGSKEELVRAYLLRRAESRQQRVLDRMARYHTPRERIVAVFEVQAEFIRDPRYRGCAFINAQAEGPRGEKITGACADTRAWLRGQFEALAAELGAASPAHLARQLSMIYDGVAVGASLDHDPAVAEEARRMAEVLIDAAIAPGRPKG